MSEESIYIVSNSDPESSCPRYVTGPTVPDWQAYCDSLAAEVSARSIDVSIKGHVDSYGHLNTFNKRVWEDDQADALVFVLLTKGYRKIDFTKYDFFWEDDPAPEYAPVIMHNLQCDIDDDEDRVRDDIREQRESKTYRIHLKEKITAAAGKIVMLGGTPKVDTELMAKLDILIEGAR